MIIIVLVNVFDCYIVFFVFCFEQVVVKVIVSGYYVLGFNVKVFEKEFVDWCGVVNCVIVVNGMEVFEFGLCSFGICEGKIVVVVGNVVMYGIIVVLVCGVIFVFVDIYFVILMMDLKVLEVVVVSQCIDVVIVIYFYGRFVDMEVIMVFVLKYGFIVFEDCVQVYGVCDVSGCKVGSFGSVVSFSFYLIKNFGVFGDGGVIVMNDIIIVDIFSKLCQYGWNGKYCNEF